MIGLIRPDWPAPNGVRAAVTTRSGGVSQGPYASLNLGDHVGDDPRAVTENRQRLQAELRLPEAPVWPKQVHGDRCIAAGETAEADAVMTGEPGRVCAVLTADCLPVLLCDRDGTRVAAAHAGWRGLAGGVLERTVAALGGEGLMAWLGPAIGPAAFEVGDEVRQCFVDQDPAAAPAFIAGRPGHWYADLYLLAQLRLRRLGVAALYGGGFCTYSDRRFFSYRRDGVTGRMATLIWLHPGT